MPASPELELWADAASAWRRQAERIAAMTRGASRALVEALEPRPGEVLLDVACGPGDPALTLARRVVPGGVVVAIDGVVDMVRAVHTRAADEPVHAVHGRAEALPFRRDVFDGVSCRFGAMFFADVGASLAAMRTVLRTGGRVVLVVWGPKERNPYFTTVDEALEEAGAPAPAPDRDRKTVFELADEDALAALARAAGFADVREQSVPFEMVLAETRPAELLDVQAEISPRVGGRVAELDDETLARARERVAERAARWTRGADLALPAECLLVVGRS